MKQSPPAVRERCDEMLNRDAVLRVLRTYKPDEHVVWSASRLLYRMNISRSKIARPDVKRRARRILEALAAEGVLVPKGYARIRFPGGMTGEVGYVRTPGVGA